MDEFWSFAGVIGLWLGVSCGLWWLHRRSVHSKQRRQMRQAARAAAHVIEAQKVFDTIRRPSVAAIDGALTAETHALLKRVQGHSGYFDKVNVLRVDMLAAFGIEEYPPLAEILHIRRDLWAASEIVLVEDLSSFGESFAEPGAYERFRAEAAALLFKSDAAKGGDEDVIDLRLSLARGEAERLAPELKDAIRLARERDRLPTVGEIVAYPVAAITAVPRKLAVAGTFLAEFYGYAAEIAGSIRRSEAMERGVSELRRAREELPPRLVTGFERASDTARQSATGLRQHYDFLVAAHDFQAKYEQTLRRAPQVTERGRQFIARLELAEHSERLRLTSANFLIWLTRQLATALAYFIAGLQQLHALLSETPPGVLAAALVAPTPVRGRDLPAFRSYRMALGVGGLSEPRPVLATAVAPTRNQAGKASMAGTAKQSAKRGATASAKTAKSSAQAKAGKAKQAASAPAKAETRHHPAEARRSAIAASAARPAAALGKAGAKLQPQRQPAQDEPSAKADRFGVPLPSVDSVAAATSAKAPPAADPPASKQADAKRRKVDQRIVKPAPSTPAEPKPDAEAPLPPAASVTAQVVQTDPSRPSATAAKRNGTDPISAKPQGVASEAAPSSLSEAPENRRRKLFSRTSSRPAETDPPPVNPEPISAQSEGVAPEAAPSGRSNAAPESGRRGLFTRTSSRGADIDTPPPASTELLSTKFEGVAPETDPSGLSDAPDNSRRKLFSRTPSRGAEIDPLPQASTEPISAKSEGVAPEPSPPGDSDAPDNGRRVLFSRTSSRGAEIEPPPPASTEPPEPQAISYPPEKRRSFLDRLLGRRPPEATIGDLLAAAWEREHAAEAGNDVAAPTPAETAPTLLGKLSALPEDETHEAFEDEDDGQDDPALDDDAGDENDDDHQSLTSSVMEVQAKLAPKPAQIRSFPWLRG